jgi:iron complex transport system substrate-binding protein
MKARCDVKHLCRVLLAALLASLAAASWAQLSVRDDRGIEQRFDTPPQRVVSLLPSLTESVCAVGACTRLVGTDRYSNWPQQVRALPKLGGLDDALVERIVALKPDVVLAASSTRAIARLQALGLKVLAFDSDRHGQVHTSLLALGRLFGDEAAARSAWAEVEADLDRAVARVPPALHGRTVYFEADASPYAAGAASFVGETLARLRLVNIAPASMGPFPALNPEAIVRAQPQVVMAAQRNLASMPQRPGWGGLQALKQGQVCAFDQERYELLIRPGPRMGRAALIMADCLAALPAPMPSR